MAVADARLFWDKIAPKYAASPIKDMQSYEMTLAKTRAYLTATDRVLEIGAGTGSTAIELAGSCAEIVATDISEKMLEVGRERAWDKSVQNIKFEHRSAQDLPEGTFDSVLAHNVLHLVPDLIDVLKAVHGGLKPGGLFISKTFLKPAHGIHLEYQMMRLLLPVLQAIGKAPYVAIYARAEFEAAFQSSGFEILESGYYPKGQTRLYLVARRL